MGKVILHIIWAFLLIFIAIELWLMFMTPRIYFQDYSHAILRPVLEEDIVGMITRKSIQANISPKIAIRIAFCESSLNPLAKNKHSSARGLYQITLATQKEAERNMKRRFDAYNPEDNIEMAFYFMKKGQWNRWLCK